MRIEKVHISGLLNQALVFDGSDYHFWEGSENIRIASNYEVSLFRNFAHDVEEIPEVTSLSQLASKIHSASEKADALDLALCSMDANEDNEIRIESLILLSEYFERNKKLEDVVTHRLFYISPLGGDFNCFETAALAKEIGLDGLSELYRVLGEAEKYRLLLDKSIDFILPEHNKSNYDTYHLKILLAINGLYSKLLPALVSRSFNEFENNVVALSVSWQNMKLPILQPAAFLKKLEHVFYNDLNRPDLIKSESSSASDFSVYQSIIAKLVHYKNEQVLLSKKKKFKRGAGRKRSDYEILVKVNRELKWINDQIDKGDEHGIWTGITELMDLQLEKSKDEHICKSLCSVASEALKFGKFDLCNQVLSLTDYLDYEDAVSYNLKAEILKDQGKFDEAIDLLDLSIQKFPKNFIARNSKADTFRLQGRLNLALETYAKTRIDFPEAEESIICGTASVLKAQGNIKGALELYSEINQRYPNSQIARTGKLFCKILLEDVRESELLQINAVLLSEDDWVDYHISAMYYLRKGIYSDALRRLERGVSECKIYHCLRYFQDANLVANFLYNRSLKSIDSLLGNISRNSAMELLEADYYGDKEPQKSKKILEELGDNQYYAIKKGSKLIKQYYKIEEDLPSVTKLKFEEEMREVYCNCLTSYNALEKIIINNS